MKAILKISMKIIKIILKAIMKIIKLIAIMILIFLLALILFLISVPIVNDHSAAKVAKRLEKIPLPEQTEYLESVSMAGKLTGNGNGMDFFGAILIKSDLSLEELDAYYEVYRERSWDCIVREQETRTVDIIEHGTPAFQTELLPEETYYIVYSWGEGTEPFAFFDLRGH